MPGTHAAHSDPERSMPDPYASAIREIPQFFGGELRVSARWVTFVKGANGKWVLNEYDPQLFRNAANDPNSFNSNQLTFTLAPLDPTFQLVTREMGAHDNRRGRDQFKRIIKPTLDMLAQKVATIKGIEIDKDFNILKEVDHLWVVGKFIPQPNNEQWTTLNFIDVFATKEECADAHRGLLAQAEFADAPQSLDDVKEVPFPGVESESEKFEREKLERSKLALWPIVESLSTQCRPNVDAFMTALSNASIVPKHYSADDPKIVELIMSWQ